MSAVEYLSRLATRLRDTAGAVLAIGAIADGEYLRRVGSTITSGVPGVGGGASWNTTAVGAGAYAVAADDVVLLCDPTAGAITINLPAAAGSVDRLLAVKRVDAAAANNVTVDGSGAEAIDGAGTYVLDVSYESILLSCDGVAWHAL